MGAFWGIHAPDWKDKATEFLSRNRHASWIGDVRAFLCELASRTWADVQELKRDYPELRWKPSETVFPIAGGQVLVSCQVILERGLVLLQRFVVAETEVAETPTRMASGGFA